MTMHIAWYDRKPDFWPDFSKDHHGTIHGETCAEIMAQFREISNNHDLAKFSRLEIVGISD